MTEPVIGIDGVQGMDRKTKGGGIFKRDKGDKHPRTEEDDSVDISEEARSRAEHDKRGNGSGQGDDAGD